MGRGGAEGTAQLAECLPSMHKVLCSTLRDAKVMRGGEHLRVPGLRR